MREMKDSGIEWIGEIPKDWKCCKVKYSTSFVGSGTTPTSSNQDFYDGDINWIQSGDLYKTVVVDTVEKKLTEKALKSFSALHIYQAPFIIMAMYGASVGNTAFSKIDACCNQACCCIKNNESFNLKFMFYWLDFAQIDFLGRAIGGTQPNISQDKIKNQYIVKPSLEEQQQIADYLDTQCSEIDATAEDIQKEISLLEEYKKSVITEAVTKGLNPDAEMKDSGIEWIGNINQKASLCRLKFFSYMKGRIGWQGLKSEDFIDNGPYCVTGTDFINGKINWDTCYHVSEERYKMDSNIQLKIGDLLVTKDGTIGKLAKVTELPEKACLNSHLLIIRPLNERFTNEYLYYVISSDVFVRYYKYSSTGSTMESLSQEKLGNFIFPVYDLLSQQQIVDYLDSQCSEIDAIIADKKRQQGILAEYKKSLIYEYVTGKKEVPVHE